MAEKDVQVGMRAPDFELAGDDGGVFHLDDERRRSPLILLFYPSDYGIVCSFQMKTFLEMDGEIARKGYRVVGISRNSVQTHLLWKERLGISFLLLADPDGEVCTMYAGLQESGLMKNMPRRAVFIVDREGIIRYAWVSHTEGMPPRFDEIRETIGSLEL